MVAVIVAFCFAVGFAGATPTPEAGAPCWGIENGGAMENAQTFAPGGAVLRCVKSDAGSEWQRLEGVSRPADTWYTYGSPQTLNAADILTANSWVSASGSTGEVCTAVQAPTGGGLATTHTNGTGYYRDFRLIPELATLTLSGHCNWRAAWERAPG